MKKLLTIILSLFVCFSLLPTSNTVLAQEEDIGEETNIEVLEDDEKRQDELPKWYTVTFVASEHGAVDSKPFIVPNNTPFVIDKNTITIGTGEYSTTVSAIPSDGYMFKEWSIKKNGKINNDTTFVASFGLVVAEVIDIFEEDLTKAIKYDNLYDALDAAGGLDRVTLLTDVHLNKDITINECILDLNNHILTTTKKIDNKGSIVLYQKNVPIFEYFSKFVQGCYGAGEILSLPNAEEPTVVIPKDTFFTIFTDYNPYSKECDFVVEDIPLVWDKDVNMGTELRVTYDLDLGGNILSPNSKKIADTHVSATRVKLIDDITVGSNNEKDGKATLFIESFDNEEGRIIPNGHKITLNLNGILRTSENVKIDESYLVCGVDGKEIEKVEEIVEKYEESYRHYIYFLANEHHFINDEYTIEYNYSQDLEFVTNADYINDEDVTVKVDGVVLDSSLYDLAHGSVHVTLHNEFIKKLKAGQHKMVIGVKGYKTEGQSFYIKAKPIPYVAPVTSVK